MSNRSSSLAQRRAELIELCAMQRSFLAEEVDALRGPLDGGLVGMLGMQKPLVLAVAGIALGLLVTRPKRLLSTLAGGMSVWKVARKVLPLLARLRGQS